MRQNSSLVITLNIVLQRLGPVLLCTRPVMDYDTYLLLLVDKFNAQQFWIQGPS